VAFQTLIGTVKSAGFRPIEIPVILKGVSNPHRYGQKWGMAERRSSIRSSFQTLIGTVKSGLVVGGAALLVFQTLIGTVKSVRGVGQRLALHDVSNPHRYGQKKGVAENFCPSSSGFKPSQVRSKGGIRGGRPWLMCSFQTLIGTVKSQATRLSQASGEAPFQTLIGTVKRPSTMSWPPSGYACFKPS